MIFTLSVCTQTMGFSEIGAGRIEAVKRRKLASAPFLHIDHERQRLEFGTDTHFTQLTRDGFGHMADRRMHAGR